MLVDHLGSKLMKKVPLASPFAFHPLSHIPGFHPLLKWRFVRFCHYVVCSLCDFLIRRIASRKGPFFLNKLAVCLYFPLSLSESASLSSSISSLVKASLSQGLPSFPPHHKAEGRKAAITS